MGCGMLLADEDNGMLEGTPPKTGTHVPQQGAGLLGQPDRVEMVDGVRPVDSEQEAPELRQFPPP